jgi:hypothetical protein
VATGDVQGKLTSTVYRDPVNGWLGFKYEFTSFGGDDLVRATLDDSTHPWKYVNILTNGSKGSANISTSIAGGSPTWNTGDPLSMSRETVANGAGICFVWRDANRGTAMPSTSWSSPIYIITTATDYRWKDATVENGTARSSAKVPVPYAPAPATPVLTWTNPLAIVFGVPLSGTQLNAKANVPGTFTYNPVAGTVLNAGNSQVLAVTFTPTDTTNYTSAATNVIFNVAKATPVLAWTAPASILYGTPLGGTQLNATANVPGAFTYTPSAGTVLNIGAGQVLGVTFTPTDTTDYSSASASVSLNVVAPIAITQSPTNQTAPVGGSILLAVQASGPTALNFQWQFNSANITGATNATLLLANLQTAAAGQYRVIVSDAWESVNSQPAAIQVSGALPSVSFQAANVSVEPGATVQVPLLVSGFTTVTSAQFSLQWDTNVLRFLGTSDYTLPNLGEGNFNTNNAATGVLAFSWDDTEVATLSNSTAIFNLRFAAIGTNGADAAVLFTDNPTAREVTVQLVVANFIATPGQVQLRYLAPAILTQPQSQSVAAYASVTFSVLAQSRAPALYQWRKDGAVLLNQTNASLVLNDVQYVNCGDYSVVVSNLAGSVTSQNASLTVPKQLSVVTWNNPAVITYPAALTESQLNASANVPGTLSYNPPAGAILNAGNGQTLTVNFVPTDTTNYTGTTATVTFDVLKAVPIISWGTPSSIVFGTALGSAQLNASANVPGSFAYDPAAGTVLGCGSKTLSVVFTPTDANNYSSATVTTTLLVQRATPVLTWSSPAPVTYGVSLGAAQLNASSSVPGTWNYNPVAGTVLGAGTHSLSVVFTPTAINDYTTANTNVSFMVQPAIPILTWNNPGDIVYGTAIGATQLNAAASVPGTFGYNPISGTVLNAGNAQALSVSFTPTDSVNYTNATAGAVINVLKATPVITWNNPAGLVYGAALGAGQLNATANVPGNFSYMPPAGGVLSAGNQGLSVTFMPTDSGNYSNATAAVSLVVVRAPLTLTAHDASRAFGQDNPAFTASLAGVQNGDNVSAAYSCSASRASAPGTYAIVPTLVDPGQKQGNYTLVLVSGTLTISNTAPVLAAIPDQAIDELTTLLWTNSVTDPDLEFETFTFSLVNAPAGVGLEPVTGLLNWRPTAAQVPSTNLITVRVNDNGTPPLNDTKTFTVVVTNALRNLTGTVRYYDGGAGLSNVPVMLSGDAIQSTTTDVSGAYSFAVKATGSYMVSPADRNDELANDGVTTLDIHLIQLHILGLVPLCTPEQLIAADANGSGTISSLDTAFLRRLVLGTFNTLPVGLWEFVASDFQFSNPTQPWAFDHERHAGPLTNHVSGLDFVGIKVGDIQGSCLTSQASANGPSPSQLIEQPHVLIQAASVSGRAGSSVLVPVTVRQFDHVTSLQFTLQWNPALLRFDGVEDFGLPGLGFGSFGTNAEAAGKLTFSWDDPAGPGARLDDGSRLFHVRFVLRGAAGTCATLSFGDRPTLKEVSVDSKVAPLECIAGEVVVGIALAPTVTLGGGKTPQFSVAVPTATGRAYVLEATISLTAPNWQAVTQVDGDGSVATLIDPNITAPQRFYRVRIR